MVDPVWKTSPISLEDWKALCLTSSYRRGSETLDFTEPNRFGVIHCWVFNSSIHLGCFFIKGDASGILASTGWCHV